MLLLRTSTLWLLLAFLAQLVCLSSGARDKGRGVSQSAAAQSAAPAAGRAQRSGAKSGGATRGKFPIKDGMQCTWTAKDVGDRVKLSVKCENPRARVEGGETDLSCEYYAKPQTCPGFQSDPKAFWKQVGRALKRLQRKVCRDERALVKAGMCKRAPRDAHFKLDMFSSVVSAQSGEDGRADHRKTAEEYCSSSWASLCSFFLSMVQSEDC
uniref:Fibroblast growth factor binding protein 1b n=1 Tax=Sphaeramia orbicularis TaxID=375764 RepID=A0A672ZVT4_9TELE